MSKKINYLSEMDTIPHSGCILVGDTFICYENYDVEDSITVDGDTPEEKIDNAISSGDIDIPENPEITVDDEDYFNENLIGDYGKLLTPEEAYESLSEEEREDLDSLDEYWSKH